MKSTFRPYRSTTRVKTRSAPIFTAPSMTTPISAALLPKPADGAEHQRREEDEHDDAGELAEDGHVQAEHQARAVLAPCRQPAERAVLALARGLDGARDLLELRVHVRAGPAYPGECGAGAHDEAAGLVGEEERAPTKMTTAGAPARPMEAPAPLEARRGVPTARKKWKRAEREPRHRDGAISARNRGVTCGSTG
jgi:hypothetical protein